MKPSPVPGRLPVHWGRPARRRQQYWSALWFLLPSLLGFVVFLLVPLLASLGMSFTDWQLLETPHLVGFANYKDLFGNDPTFWPALLNTLIYTVEYVCLNVVVSLAMALWIASLRRGKALLRLIFFLPTFTPLIGISIVWLLIFTPDGLMDYLFKQAHLNLPNLLGSPALAMQAVVLVSLWAGFGYNLILFGSALDAVPRTYLEAAQIDGASPWQRFWSVTVPMISPTLFFGIVMTTITGFQVFDQVYVLTHGGPGSATTTLGYNIFQNGFTAFHFGYAATIAWVLFVLIMAVTALQFWLQRRWVTYDA